VLVGGLEQVLEERAALHAGDLCGRIDLYPVHLREIDD
jgi:hypothetical protein